MADAASSRARASRSPTSDSIRRSSVRTSRSASTRSSLRAPGTRARNSTLVRIAVSGVRSSWEASATKRRWESRVVLRPRLACSSSASIWLNDSERRPSSSCGSPSTGMRWEKSRSSPMRWAVARMRARGRSRAAARPRPSERGDQQHGQAAGDQDGPQQPQGPLDPGQGPGHRHLAFELDDLLGLLGRLGAGLADRLAGLEPLGVHGQGQAEAVGRRPDVDHLAGRDAGQVDPGEGVRRVLGLDPQPQLPPLAGLDHDVGVALLPVGPLVEGVAGPDRWRRRSRRPGPWPAGCSGAAPSRRTPGGGCGRRRRRPRSRTRTGRW